MSHEDYLYKMSNIRDPFHGNVTYLNRRDLEADNDPLTSMDGMLVDIIQNCKAITSLRRSNITDRHRRIEGLVKEIVKLYQGVCFLRLRRSLYRNVNDDLFCGCLNEATLDVVPHLVSIRDLWELIFEKCEKLSDYVRHHWPPWPSYFLGSLMDDIEDICDNYQGIIISRMAGR